MVTPLLLEALLEAYVFRRAVCAILSYSQQKPFATFSRALRREKSHYLPSFKAHLLALPSYRRFPSDEEFRREIQIRNLYKLNKSCSYWLHRLGNLTLTGYNPVLGNRPFLDKRDGKGGFAKSPLHLNEGLSQLERWDVDAMRLRGERLAERALAVWPAPQLSEEQRLAYQPAGSRSKATAYTLADHPQLASPVIRAVFDALDARIRSLDPNVSQEILKLYIAYKANQLRRHCSSGQATPPQLNMPFPELDDPKGMASNVAGIGRWGNGDFEIGVATLDEVPYALGLILQSLERQLDDAPEVP
jgi:predicted transport protein